jgi:hypothetical protein
MVLQIAHCVVDDLLSRRSQLSELSWMGSHSMTQLADHFAYFTQCFASKRLKLVAILVMACEWKHLATQAHELDAVLVVPAHHFDNIPRISKAYLFHIFHSSRDIRWLFLIGAVFSGMFGL